MKKIIALALALVMALSMASVAFAAAPTYAQTLTDDGIHTDANTNTVAGSYSTATVVRPGTTIKLNCGLNGWKIAGTDFTTGDLEGASLIESVKIAKDKTGFEVKVKESYTMALETAKNVAGNITIKNGASKATYYVTFDVNNDTSFELDGARKASLVVANSITAQPNAVQTMDDEGGYVSFTVGELTGVAKMAKNEKVYFNLVETLAADVDTQDAIEAVLGEDYDGIVEYYQFETRAFKDAVDFTYEAYAEDDHFFYAWDGEKLTALDAKFNDDEEVNAYEFSAIAEGVIVITDVEVVLAEEETKNPDTGANDVVGVAAALAVVSLVAAGAVSLKK